MAITGQAWVWRTACNVFLIKVIYYVLLKLVLNIDKIKGYVELTRDASCIIDRFKGAAFILRNTYDAIIFDDAGFRPQAQHHANHLVTFFLK